MRRTGQSRTCHIARTFGALLAAAFFLSGCSSPNSTVLEAFEVQNALSKLCFDTAMEHIDKQAIPLRQLFISDVGNVSGAWDFDLFFGTNKPAEWAGLKVLPPEQKSSASGAFEVAYEHTPITVSISKKTHVFRRVTQTVTDLGTGKVIAERRNILFGADFNRGWQCLDADWFRGNEAFIERTIGKRYILPQGSVQQAFPVPTRYVKAALVQSQNTSINLRAFSAEELLPRGSVYQYNDRKLKLRDGEFYLTHGRREPLRIAKSIETNDRYFFILLPDGGVNSWPLRQLLLEERLLSGQLLRNTIVQIPPAVDWRNGWGLDPDSLALKNKTIEFKILGTKVLKERYEDQKNQGHYRAIYQFRAPLPYE